MVTYAEKLLCYLLCTTSALTIFYARKASPSCP